MFPLNMKLLPRRKTLVALSGTFSLGAALFSLADSLQAQTETPLTTGAKVATAPATNAPAATPPVATAPASLTGDFAKNGQNAPNPGAVFSNVAPKRALKIALYKGPGVGGTGVDDIQRAVKALNNGSTVTILSPEDVGTRDLSGFDIIVFSGGSGSAQSKAIGEKGQEAVRQFVANGGGYLGICAGAYLACSGFSWGLDILNAKTVSQKWARGAAFLELEMTDESKPVFGDVKDKFFVRYHNGPIIKPDSKTDLPSYKVDSYFRTEVAQGTAPVGVQVNSPAIVRADYKNGRVLTISPHPESTKGLENLVPHALVWLGDKK